MKSITLNDAQSRRLLAGERVEVRRPVKDPPEYPMAAEWYHPTIVRPDGEEDAGPQVYGMADEDRGWVAPWAPGDVLWVRSTYAYARCVAVSVDTSGAVPEWVGSFEKCEADNAR
jgi:hypothetical protein